MMRCPSCSNEVPDGSLFCARCGAEVASTEAPTRTSLGPGAASSNSPSSPTPPPTATNEPDRFPPGTVVSERYRIVGLLGRGGMGEVYRADDLTLGQPAALKFLPEAFERDPDRLERFLGEIRSARQITHPNVCRVHDVGQVDGQHFLSMEYVDGEDLAGLLRRIGRLPPDKATEIARQLASGVAAAHDQGILHRDLKPANIMLDGRGRVRITDFGLAGLAGTIEGAETRVGTPAYMAPEQLAGQDVTTKSDIYALGLVLYELYTGKKPFEASSMLELQQLRQETTPSSLSSHVEGLDPAVERVILRCLERDPANRPPSALAVSAALPGGDPLAAALAAGETPSPEMVANAGESGGLAPRVALGLLATALLAILLTATVVQREFLHRMIPFDQAPEELRGAGERILEDLGYDELPRFRDSGFRENLDLLENIAELDVSMDRWERLRSGDPPGLLFWQRLGKEPLWPSDTHGEFIERDQPPRIDSGSSMIELDTQGRLVALEAIPEEKRVPSTVAAPEWAKLLRHAGFERDPGKPAAIEKTPPVPTTELIAWEVETPGEFTEERSLIQAGAFDGIPNYFEILRPWERKRLEAEESPEEPLSDLLFGAFILMVLAGIIFLAARNLRRGRGDRRGAFRMAAITGGAIYFATLLPVLRLENTGFRLVAEMMVGQVMGHALLHAVLTWVIYIAIEPYARRLWPQVLVSWSRLMVGRLRDPMVGRDILIGCAFLAPQTLVMVVMRPFLRAVGWPTSVPFVVSLGGPPNLGVRESVAEVFGALTSSLSSTLALLSAILLLRLIFRRSWIAIGVLGALVVALFLTNLLQGGEPVAVIVFLAVAATMTIGVPIFVLMRYGLIAAAALMGIRSLITSTALTLDPSSWHAPGAFVILAAALAPVIYGFWVSLAGRAVFGDMLEQGGR